MSSPVIALSRYQRSLVLDPAEARDLSIRRRINAAWGLLCLNTMTFVAGYSVLGIPSKVGKGFAQAALPLAILLLLTVNPKLKIRPNVFLCIVCLLVLDAVITATQVNRLGTDFRTFRFAEFMLALWLLTPWWGRRDLLLLRCHLLWLYIALGSVLLGLLISPGRAFSYGGRLTGAIWPMLPTQIAGYAGVACGLTVMLWLGRLVSGRATVAGAAATIVILLLTHTRTALIAMVAGHPDQRPEPLCLQRSGTEVLRGGYSRCVDSGHDTGRRHNDLASTRRELTRFDKPDRPHELLGARA